MISNAAGFRKSDLETPNSSLKIAKDAARADAARPEGRAHAADRSDGHDHGAASAPDWTYDSHQSLSYQSTEDLYLKYTTRDGDTVELSYEKTETLRVEDSVHVSADAKALAAGADDAAAADKNGKAEETDPKAKQLAELREWAKQVEHEVRLQNRKILEQMLKQSGRFSEAGEGRFLMIMPDGKPGDAGNTENTEDAQVPPYWNAENTSDRIVHFATQMAEISGMEPEEFFEKIKDAVSAGFDQAAAATGELTGAAAKLNKDTKDLVFSKLSKWLEDRKGMPYNQGAQNPAGAQAAQPATSTAEVPHGIENHQQ
jgi:hypothetical protein